MSDTESPVSSEDESVLRPARNKSIPLRLRESVSDLDVDEVDPERLVIVRCSQTGKKHTVRVKDLSNENALEPITESSLSENASLLMQYRGKSYPAVFVEFKDKGKNKHGKVADKKSKNDKKKKNEVEEVEILTRAKDDSHKPPPSKKARAENSTMLDNSDKDLLVNVVKRMDKIEATLAKLEESSEKLVLLVQSSADALSPSPGGTASGDVKKEGGNLIVEGVNVMLLPARDAYAFGLQLLDIFFTKEELSRSLLYKSKKSEKPELPREKVEKLVSCIQTRYGSNWDLKTFTAKANQKCRDSSPKATEA